MSRFFIQFVGAIALGYLWGSCFDSLPIVMAGSLISGCVWGMVTSRALPPD